MLAVILVVFPYKTPKKSTRANYTSSANHCTLGTDIKAESGDKAGRIQHIMLTKKSESANTA
jgi:hypothetical protein